MVQQSPPDSGFSSCLSTLRPTVCPSDVIPGVPSPSMSRSQASPFPFPSVSRWSLFETLGQLSQASPYESLSEFCWSLLGTRRQLSCTTADAGGHAVTTPRANTHASTHLHILDAVPIGVLVALVANGIVVCVLLPGVWRVPAVVLTTDTQQLHSLSHGRRVTSRTSPEFVPPAGAATALTCLQCLWLSRHGRGRSGYPSMSVSTPHV